MFLSNIYPLSLDLATVLVLIHTRYSSSTNIPFCSVFSTPFPCHSLSHTFWNICALCMTPASVLLKTFAEYGGIKMIGNEHPLPPPGSSEERGGSSVLPSPNISGQVLENRKGFRIVLESQIRTLILYLSHVMN